MRWLFPGPVADRVGLTAEFAAAGSGDAEAKLPSFGSTRRTAQPSSIALTVGLSYHALPPCSAEPGAFLTLTET